MKTNTDSLDGSGAGFSPNRTKKRQGDTFTMSLTVDYIADHIDRIDRGHGGKENLILDSKWRIASALGMFGDDLNPNGILPPDQVTKVDAYIAKFKASPAGRDAIAQLQRRAG